MGVLDALTILGSGLGKGYRRSQELMRQIADARRKALLEEREQNTRDQLAKSQVDLNAAQVPNLNAEAAYNNARANEIISTAKDSDTPLGTSPLHFRIFGNDITTPNTFRYLKELTPAANDELRSRTLLGVAGINQQGKLGAAKITAQAKRDVMQLRLVNGAGGHHLSPAEMRLRILEKANSQFSDPDEWHTYVDFARANLPEAFADDTTGTSSRLNDPAGIR